VCAVWGPNEEDRYEREGTTCQRTKCQLCHLVSFILQIRVPCSLATSYPPGARDFAEWLFQQVDLLNSQNDAGHGFIGGDSGTGQGDVPTVAQDAEVGDASEPGNSNMYALSQASLLPYHAKPIYSLIVDVVIVPLPV
jgi:hypothetical protein